MLDTVEEVKKYAMKHYNEGLDVIIECWGDKEIQELIDRENVMDSLSVLQSVVNEERAAAKYFSGTEENSSDNSDDEWFNEYDPYLEEEEYEREYSPSTPWNAPGMSVSDRITGVKYN